MCSYPSIPRHYYTPCCNQPWLHIPRAAKVSLSFIPPKIGDRTRVAGLCSAQSDSSLYCQHGKDKVGGRTFGHSEIHTSRLQQKIKTFSYCCPKSYQQNLWNILCTISVFEIRYGMSLAARFHVLLVFPSLYFVLRREKRVLGRRPLGTRRWPKALRSSSADGIGGYQGEGEERGGWIRTGWRSTNSARGRRIARGGGRGRYKGGKLATEKGKGV